MSRTSALNVQLGYPFSSFSVSTAPSSSSSVVAVASSGPLCCLCLRRRHPSVLFRVARV